jgi:3-hydroxybutyryl-CoA dehydrogenase
MRVRRIAVIGAGTIGRGIACLAALSGFETILEDIRPQTLEQAMNWMRRTIEGSAQKGATSCEEARLALGRVRLAGRVEEACDADLVIETGPEEMELKTELFGMLDKFARANTILATTSPSLSVAEMAAVTQRPELCIGMRFFDPVTETGGLDLVCTSETSDETLDACRDVGRRMAKDVKTLGEPA